jgi:hypothetical protein
VSEVARLAVVAVLENSGSDTEAQPSGEPDAAEGGPVKPTIRFRRGVASRLTTRARACGLSYGAYLTTLIDEAPAPPLGVVTAWGRPPNSSRSSRLTSMSWCGPSGAVPCLPVR